ncbi:MAG: hypothetical protein ACK4FM_04265, partial [Caldimicrobium sp.]
LLWKLFLFSGFAFAFAYLFHLVFVGSRLRYILPSVCGFVFLVSLVIYYLSQYDLPKPKFLKVLVKGFSIINVFLSVLFLFYLQNKNLPIPSIFYLIHLGFILLNLIVFIKFEPSIKPLLWYLVFYVFLLKHLYVFFYYPLHQVKMNYHRKAAVEIGNMLKTKNQKELYLCKTLPPDLIYYLKYRYKMVDGLIYIRDCRNLPPKSFIIVMQKDYDLNWDRSVKAIPFKIREKRYYLLYKE